jgi:hypothetical protein
VARDKYGNKAFDGYVASNNKKKKRERSFVESTTVTLGIAFMITSGHQIANTLNYRTYILLKAPATKDIQRKCGYYKEICNTFSPIKSQLPYFTSDRYALAGVGILLSGLR